MIALSTLLNLYYTFFCIGIVCFGGGYAAVKLTQEQVVIVNGWLTFDQFSQILAISEMTPGPLALNAASFVGTKLAGWPGAVSATLGLLTAPALITGGLAWLYGRYKECRSVEAVLKGIKPVVIGMLASVAVSFTARALNISQDFSDLAALKESLPDFSLPSVFFVALLLCGLRFKKLNSISAILGIGLFGILLELLFPGFSL